MIASWVGAQYGNRHETIGKTAVTRS